MALSREDVREQLRATVDGRITVTQFEDWLVANSWNIHLSGAPEQVQQLVYAIDHDLATIDKLALPSALARRLQQLDAPPLTVVDWKHGQSLNLPAVQTTGSVSSVAPAWRDPADSRGTVITIRAPRRPAPLPVTA